MKSKIFNKLNRIQKKTEHLINTTYLPYSKKLYNDNREKYEPMLIGREISIEACKELQELLEE